MPLYACAAQPAFTLPARAAHESRVAGEAPAASLKRSSAVVQLFVATGRESVAGGAFGLAGVQTTFTEGCARVIALKSAAPTMAIRSGPQGARQRAAIHRGRRSDPQQLHDGWCNVDVAHHRQRGRSDLD